MLASRIILRSAGATCMALCLTFSMSSFAGDDEFKIEEVKWDHEKDRLQAKGKGQDGNTVTIFNAANLSEVGSDNVDDHEWRVREYDLSPVPCRIRAVQSDGQVAEKDVKEAPDDCDDGGGSGPPPVASGDFTLVAANDLGMHCADLDYQVFSILPPFNVVHAQVIKQGTGATADTLPRLQTDRDVVVVYSAVSNDLDPAGPGSINTTSNPNVVYKTNFWDLAGGSQIAGKDNTLGGLAYAPLYPSVLAGELLDPAVQSFLLDSSGILAFAELCDTPEFPNGCPSILNVFEPLAPETGLPVPDLHNLFPPEGSGLDPVLAVAQQKMPGLGNTPQHFDRFDANLPFFVNFPFGYTIEGANWFAADGIPILPIDDSGNPNAYPLMRVQAFISGAITDPNDGAYDSDKLLASVDVVLPVASEADCQGCHAAMDDPALVTLGYTSNGAAVEGASVDFEPQSSNDSDTPGTGDLNRLQNAAKINILRLHDAKHKAKYETWDSTGTLVAAVCDPAIADDPNCLINQTPVQCSQCHYSPALDLAQAGPVDEPDQGPRGRQQRQHISQSRAMHGHHGQFTALFPPMPGPNDPLRLEIAMNVVDGSGHSVYPNATDPYQIVEDHVLEQTCYTCHPGKNTQCLRGAMYNGGMRCHDCHGDMAQVGNDFTENFPSDPFVGDGTGGEDLSKRVSWASEPGCQSCHTGDAVDNLAGDYPDVVAPDNIRLLQAYETTAHPVDGSKVASIIEAPASRFAENQDLYRLSQGHGGVKCQGCHGSTHAIWPVNNPPGKVANDNLASIQLQGHEGKIQECDACHAKGSLGLTLGGPHGMHPVSDPDWTHNHEDFLEHNSKGSCRACHGMNGEGTVLARTADERVLESKEEQPDGSKTITLSKGTLVSCDLCHENKL